MMKPLAFLCMLVHLLLGTKGCTEPLKAPEGGLVRYAYVMHGTVAEPLEDSEVMIKKNGSVVLKRISRTHYGHNESFVVSGEVLDHLLQIIQEENVLAWEHSYSPKGDIEVLDGESWQLDLEFKDGSTFSFSGNNAYPEGGGLKRMNDYIYSLKK